MKSGPAVDVGTGLSFRASFSIEEISTIDLEYIPSVSGTDE